MRNYEDDPNAFKDATIDFFYDEYFKGEEGHDYTDDEITMSVNKSDIDNCLAIMKDLLYKHFGIKEEVEYICVADYQDTYFHIGDTKTAEEWKEWALSMNDMDECESREEFAKLPPQEAMNYVADMWQIGFEVFDPKNEEHVKLRKEYEGKD